MNLIDSVSLCVIMITLAAIPSASVALVVTRSATLGIPNGIAVALGIVSGDLIFVSLAIAGLSAITEALGDLSIIIKYLGGAYLIWLGLSLFLSDNRISTATIPIDHKKHIITSFLSGLFLTMGDIKAIFFYASLFPIFIDLSSIVLTDIAIIIAITIITVGGVKISYAIAAGKMVSLPNNPDVSDITKKIAGCILIGAGSYLIITA